MNLFVVHNSNQLKNCIVISQTQYRNMRNDLYYTVDIEEEAERAKCQGIFNDIYKIEFLQDLFHRNNILKKTIVQIKLGIDFKKVKKNLPNDPKIYKKIFCSGVNLKSFEYYYAVKQKNNKCQLYLYEEGINEYYCLGKKKDFFKAIYSHFFFRHYYPEECTALYVHSPDLVDNKQKNIKLLKIDNILDNKDLIQILNEVFKYDCNRVEKIKNKFIFLDSAFYNIEQDKYQIFLVEKIAEVVGKDNLLIKLHPRSAGNKYGKEYKIIDIKVPFEIIFLNNVDFINNIFVSVASSSVLNIKMIFNLEPKIIMLHEIMRVRFSKEVTDTINRANKKCNNKYLIPREENELIEIIKTVFRDIDMGR